MIVGEQTERDAHRWAGRLISAAQAVVMSDGESPVYTQTIVDSLVWAQRDVGRSFALLDAITRVGLISAQQLASDSGRDVADVLLWLLKGTE